MERARLEMALEPGGDEDVSGRGLDRGEFRFSANPGEELRPLARIASGGELSRTMLAIQAVLAAADRIPTMVFDEVDAGIGGEAGVAVGRLLQTLGSRHQVLCVTHLAQVAAFAGMQVVVEKTVEQVEGRREERTVASAAVVDGESRVAELSRMLAGIGDSSHARRHAAELLETAAASGRARSSRRGRR
jgi:DNA repair protein RecN (Recombination protein N)